MTVFGQVERLLTLLFKEVNNMNCVVDDPPLCYSENLQEVHIGVEVNNGRRQSYAQANAFYSRVEATAFMSFVNIAPARYYTGCFSCLLTGPRRSLGRH